MQPVLVGIAGGSGSGKTSLVNGILERRPGQVAAISFDDYYRDQTEMSPAERAAVNYDHPDSLDVELFTEHLAELRAGRAIELPRYDFALSTRLRGADLFLPAPVVLIDGILLLTFAEVRTLLDLMVFVDVAEDVRFQRRLMRDVVERGRTAESVRAQFDTTVAPMHDRFVQPSRLHAHLELSGESELLHSVDAVLDAIDGRLDRDLVLA